MIELALVNKIFNRGQPGEVHVLHDISISISSGEMVCLKGPSGSGKTTLLSIIGCVVPPSSGKVTIGGRKVSRLPDHFLSDFRRDSIGFIFQHFNMLPELSVLENITLPLYPCGISPMKRRAMAMPLVERLGLAHRVNFRVQDISGGELQRVAICRALIHSPPIILADEPTAHLDSPLAAQFMDLLAHLKSEGMTVVLTSHDRRVYEDEHIDRVFDIVDGRMVANYLSG